MDRIKQLAMPLQALRAEAQRTDRLHCVACQARIQKGTLAPDTGSKGKQRKLVPQPTSKLDSVPRTKQGPASQWKLMLQSFKLKVVACVPGRAVVPGT